MTQAVPAVLREQSRVGRLLNRVVQTIHALSDLLGPDALEDQLQRDKIIKTTVILCQDDAPLHETTESRLTLIVGEVLDFVALENAQNPPIEETQ